MKGQADAAAASGDMSVFGLGKYLAPADSSGSVTNPFSGDHPCVNPSITLFGQSRELGVCGVVSPIKVILFWAFNVIAALYAWSAFARRRGAGA